MFLGWEESPAKRLLAFGKPVYLYRVTSVYYMHDVLLTQSR